MGKQKLRWEHLCQEFLPGVLESRKLLDLSPFLGELHCFLFFHRSPESERLPYIETTGSEYARRFQLAERDKIIDVSVVLSL